jgi:hypothetical protein
MMLSRLVCVCLLRDVWLSVVGYLNGAMYRYAVCGSAYSYELFYQILST